jgi:hypothetical protein
LGSWYCLLNCFLRLLKLWDIEHVTENVVLHFINKVISCMISFKYIYTQWNWTQVQLNTAQISTYYNLFIKFFTVSIILFHLTRSKAISCYSLIPDDRILKLLDASAFNNWPSHTLFWKQYHACVLVLLLRSTNS